MVTAAEEHDIIEMEEKDMIHSVFEFSDTMVREVMVPRPDMVALPATATVKDALNVTIEHGYSRIPVYGSNLDEILGILYAKDLIQYLQTSELDKPVSQVVRDAFIIPETKILSDLLRELRKRKVHIAIVVDEYGTVVGLVTIEDLLEEIVGEIFDEFDREINLVEKVEENRYRVDARVNLDDLNEILQIDLPDEEDVDTVGGLVLKVLGHLPIPGETLTYNGVAIRVEKVRSNRITKVLFDILPPAPEGGD
jgi:CBS domain containing-hemolysin-like protein